MAALDFPANPTAGQVYEGDNGVIYTYVGTAPNGHWSAFAELSSESFADIFVEVKGDNMTGDLTLGTDKITLKAADGSITALSTVGSALSPDNGANEGWGAKGYGLISACRSNDTDPVFRAYKEGNNTPTALIKADGSAGFSGSVEVKTATSPWIEVGYGTEGSGTHRISWDSAKLRIAADMFNARTSSAIVFDVDGVVRQTIDENGNVLIGGTLPSSPNIELKAAGMARFKRTDTDNNQDFQALIATSSAGFPGVSGWGINVQADPAVSDEGSFISYTGEGFFSDKVMVGGLSTSPNISLNADGTSVFSNYLKIDKTSTNSSAALIEGNLTFSGTTERVFAADGRGFYVGDVTNYGSGTFQVANIKLNADGSATFAKVVTIGTPGSSAGSLGAYLNAGSDTSQLSLYSNVAVSGTVLGTFPIIVNSSPDAVTSKTPRFAVKSDGTTILGGTLPASPNISLNADGSAAFASGRCKVSNDGVIDIQAVSNSANGSVLLRAGSANLTAGANAFVVKADGSAEFAGDVQSGGNSNQGAETGILVRERGLIEIARSNGSETLWAGYLTGTSSTTSSIKADGSASFADRITTGTATTNAGLLTVTHNAASSGAAMIRGVIGTDTANPTFLIKADGSAEFAGAVKIGGTAAANEIDEYEEGNWTPTYSNWTTAPPTTSGKYVKIGQQVSIFLMVNGACETTTSSTVGGLPFTLGNFNFASGIFVDASSTDPYPDGNKFLTVAVRDTRLLLESRVLTFRDRSCISITYIAE